MAANDDAAAVECIELDDSSSDESSVLQVLAPQKPVARNEAHKNTGNDDSSDDESFLLEGGPVFSSSNSSSHCRRQEEEATTRKPAAKTKLTKEEREEQRRRDKERREEEKRLAKLARQDERTRKRREKEATKLAEQESKRRRILVAQQTSGKFAQQEICVLMEPTLLQCLETTDTLMETYAVHPYSLPGCTQKGTIRWIRKDYTSGGAQDAIEALQAGNTGGYQLLDRVVILFHEPNDFIRMLQRSDVDDDYPLLEAWLDSIHHKPTGKLVLLLHQVNEEVHKQWNAHRRTKRNPPPPTDAELQDAIVWLLIQFQVECISCSTQDNLLLNLKKMTRALSEEPYQQQVTELECIKKLKAECSDSSDAFSKANDTWIRQLQQVPRVSEGMARNVAQYFPTAKSLWDAYQDANRSEAEKRLLLAPLFSEGRQQTKLSDTVYRLLTSSNPNEFL